MVPRKLRLHNFMAYRALDPPLDFAGIHLACLSGPNGAGKSTLLDAITWALWGQARAKSDDELVTLGQSEMEVEFEFSLGEDCYRVIRKRSRAGNRKTGQSMLELQIAGEGVGDAAGEDADEARFFPLTGNTLRDTQRRIEELLRLDYHTFINSSLLLQGRDDEFTVKAPGERKRVLGNILGLGRYDMFEEHARQAARRRELDIASLQAETVGMEQQLAARPTYEAELLAQEQQQEQLSALLAAQEQALQGLRLAQQQRADKARQLDELEARIQRSTHELQELQARAATYQRQLAELQPVLERREEAEQAVAEYLAAKEEHDRLDLAFRELFTLREQETRLSREAEQARGELALRERSLQQEALRLRERIEARPALQRAAAEAQEVLDGLVKQEWTLSEIRARLDQLTQRISVMEHQNQEVVRQGQELRAKVEQLQQPGASGICPLCGTELGPEGHERIIQEYHQELERQRDLYRSNERELRRLKEEQSTLQGQGKELEQRLVSGGAAAQAKLTNATQGLEETDRAAAQEAPLQAEFLVVQQVLASGSYAPQLQDALAQLQGRIAALGYDSARHEALKGQLQQLEPRLALAQRLEEAARRMPELQQEERRTREALERWQQELVADQARQHELTTELSGSYDPSAELAQSQLAVDSTRAGLTAANTAIGRLQAAIERCRDIEALLVDRRRRLAIYGGEREIYNDLALAFGRRGIQALLIDSALPELEDDANQLLGRMTDNRLHLTLQTQRTTRSGSVTETLDIKIADEAGTRAYELYSGGEAFRINFALRIALSRLLARRAGAPLPTLVIDEGFGTQDAAGRERLIAAINAIAADFQCILVITHIEDLKDAFPVRIEVSKSTDGARAEIVYG